MRTFFIDRPNFAIVLSLFIVIVGLIAAFHLPISQYPQIVPPRVNVNTSYSGANSEVVEQSIAQLLEQQINGVQDMVEMQSTSQDNGYYSLNVKFELGKNEDMSLVQIQNAVAQTNANMPQEAQQNGIIARKVTPDTVLYFVLWSPNGTYDRVLMKNYATININDEIRRIKGVGNVNEYGADFGMRIWQGVSFGNLRDNRRTTLSFDCRLAELVQDCRCRLLPKHPTQPAAALGRIWCISHHLRIRSLRGR